MTAVRAGADQDGRFERDRLAVGLAQATQVDDRLAGRDAEAGCLGCRGRTDDAGQHARARDAPGPEHLVGEGHQPVGAAMRRRLGDEAAAPRFAGDQAVLGQPVHGVPGGHPADPELGAQLGVRRQPLAGPQGRDPLAQRLLDLAVLRLVGRARSWCRRPVTDRSREPTVAPRRPRRRGSRRRSPRPRSRARRSRSRRRRARWSGPDGATSSRIGSSRSSPAAETPPPMTTRSGEMTVIMLPMPMPR